MEPKNSPQPQYKLPTLAQEAQIQKGKDIEAERRNIFNNAFAQNAKKPTVWDNMYTQGINFQPTSKGGVNLERYIDRDEFKTLGFNPFIDNESYYQSNTGFWDDFAAARKGQWDLFKIGLFSHYGTSDQYEKAQRYERAANIGTSQRTNTASRVFNNAVLNSGYTLGLMTGIVAEEIALGFLTGGVGNLAKIPSTALRITDKINDASTIIKAIERGKDVNKMRQIWDVTKATTGNIGKAIVPFGNTADMVLNWSRLGVKVGDDAYQLLDAGAKTSKLFGSFYRDTREILMAHDESKLEAAMLYNTMMDQMILDYQNKNDFGLPTEKDVEAFHQIARYQQDRSYWKNMMLIYASNRISFGNIFNKFNPRVLRVGEKALFQNSAGRVIADWGNKNVRQVLNEGFLNATTFRKEALSFAKNWRHSWKYIPKGIAKYTRANIGEGFQEIGQEIINHAEENIGMQGYTKYMQGVRGGFLDDALYSTNFLDGYRESAAHFVSAEGGEIFATGFLMGGIAGPYTYFAGKTTDASTWQNIASYRNKTTRAERKAELIKAKEQLDKAQEKFTNLSSKEQEHIYKYVLDISRQAGRARLLDEANEDKNAKRFFDVKDETLSDYILDSLNHGTFDVFVENLQDLLQLSEGELADAFKEQLNFEDANELSGIKQRAQDIIGSAKSIKKAYDNADSIFPELLAFTEAEKEQYKGVNLDALRQVRNMYIKTFVTQQHQLQRNLERVSKIHEALLGKGSPFNSTKDIPLTAVSTLFSEETMNREIEALESEIDTLKQTITSQKKADPKENPGAKIILARSEAALNTAEGKLKRTKELNGAFSDFTSRTRYLSLLENLQKALNSKQPGMIIGSNITFKITEAGKETPYLGTIIDAEVNEKGDVITKVRYLPEGATKEVETTINISQETIEELNVDTNTEGLKLSEKTQKMLRAYMDDVAKNSNTTIDPTKFDKFTQDLLDAKILKSEEEDLANMITLLMNPGVYAEMNKQFLDRHLKNKENLKFVVRADLQEYYKTLNKNNLLQILIEKYNIFIRGNDLASIVDGLIIPEPGEITMYDAKTLETIEPTNSRYQGALEEITEYVENLTEAEEETKTKEETTEETQEEKETTTPITSITVDSVKNLNSLPQEFRDMLKEKIDELNIQLEEAGTEKIDINNLDLENYDIRMLVQSVIDDYNNKSKPPETSSATTTSQSETEEQAVSEEQAEIIESTENVIDKYKKLGLPIIETDNVDFTSATKEILETEPAFVIFSLEDISRSKLPDDFGGKDHVLHVKSKDRLYYFIAQDTESHRAQARSNMLSLGYPTKPTGRFTIEVPYDDTTSIYVDSEDVRQFLSDEELVNDLKIASVLVTGIVQEENSETKMLADMFDAANTIVNEELNSLKDLETVKDKLEDLLVSLRDVSVDVKNQFYKENIQPLINQKLESIKESIKPSDFKLNTAHKYQGIVYLVKKVEENSVIFVTPGQNTLTEVEQKDLWQTEPVDMDNIPQEKPVTAEEKERFSEAKENNIDVSAIVDSLSKEDMLSESEFTEDFINDLLPKCD